MGTLFVHGALVRDGAWWWSPTAALLDRAGVRSRADALPSCGDASSEDGASGLTADAAAPRRAHNEIDDSEGVIVVGHSYGGTVVAEAGHHPAVARLLFVSSCLPDVGQAQGAIMADEPGPVSIGDAGDGRLAVAGYEATSHLVYLDDGRATVRLRRTQAPRAPLPVYLPKGHRAFITR